MIRHDPALSLVSWALLRRSLGLMLLLNFCLSLAQLVKLTRGLSQADPWPLLQSWLGLLKALSLATPVMWEATAPLLALVVSALVYHQLHLEGYELAWRATGKRPLRLILPAFSLGLCLAISAAYTAHYVTPSALCMIGDELRVIAAQSVERGLRDGRISGLSVGVEGGPLSRRGPLKVLSDQESGLIWLWSPPDRLYLRAHLDPSKELFKSTDAGSLITLSDISVASPKVSFQLDELRLSMRRDPLHKALKSLSAPNNLQSDQLGMSAHERFTFHKRSALPTSAVAWSILGALLGLLGQAQRSTLACGALVAAAYSLLRFLELRARFEGGDPLMAAWLPTILLTVCAGGALSVWLRRGGRW